ncbi:MAG: hypothetical protein KF800_00240 [Lysobacter sp.]|nr:hypothetical protein [Xanthomonadaceae bacterium]MBX3710380.1 hypothetical protein [Lysobacter sp.]
MLTSLFGWLFAQYRDSRRLLFGSRWMNLHGRLFLGPPETLGLAEDLIGENVRRTYFYLPTDRHPPTDERAFKKWQKDQLYATQTREASQPHVALGASLIGVALCTCMTLAAAQLSNGTPPIPLFAGGGSAAVAKPDQKQCEQAVLAATRAQRMLTPAELAVCGQ